MISQGFYETLFHFEPNEKEAQRKPVLGNENVVFCRHTRHLNQFGAERKVGREHLRIQGRDSSKFEILFIETLNSRANCQEPDFRLKH